MIGLAGVRVWNFLYGESLTVYYLKEPDLPRDEWERMGNGAIKPVEWCAHCFRRSLACRSVALVLLLLLSLSESLDIMWTSPILSALPAGSLAPMTIRSMSSTRTSARKA